MRAPGDIAGQYIEAVGRSDMATWSEADWRGFIEAICGAYVDAWSSSRSRSTRRCTRCRGCRHDGARLLHGRATARGWSTTAMPSSRSCRAARCRAASPAASGRPIPTGPGTATGRRSPSRSTSGGAGRAAASASPAARSSGIDIDVLDARAGHPDRRPRRPPCWATRPACASARRRSGCWSTAPPRPSPAGSAIRSRSWPAASNSSPMPSTPTPGQPYAWPEDSLLDVPLASAARGGRGAAAWPGSTAPMR